MASSTLYVISAPSGCGKTSLIKALLASIQNLTLSVSYTTRQPRKSEIQGINYHFIKKNHFHEMIQAKHFVEYAKVFGHYYGTSLTWIKQQLQQNEDVLLEIDWQGARKIRKYYSDIVSIFILPPSIESLRARLLKRGEDCSDIIETRIKQAYTEIQHYPEYDYLIMNNQFDEALANLKTIIQARRLRTISQSCIAKTFLTESGTT